MAIQLYSENHGFCFGGSQYIDENSSGFGFGFGFDEFSSDLHHQKQICPQEQYPQLQNMEQRSYHNTTQSMEFSIASTFEKQMEEISRFITLQNERLRLVLQQERKNQLSILVKKYESRAEILLKAKDEEIAKLKNRTMELEDYLNKMEIQKQTWIRLAKENEGIVNSLTNTIQHVKETNNYLNANGVCDAESWCVETGENRGHENQEIEEEQRTALMMICKSCNSRNSCCILLPCRHLCSCKDCEAFLDSCPVCGMLKNSSIEALV